jgi:pyruvate/2-oxoglutarate dehydrogenase complex dihydrolipoamide dehydrogenase (E3) component
MMAERADVVVLGMGVAGEAVAGSLAEAGLDVVGVDRALVGGECPYWGCIPTKMMVRAANLLAEARRIPGVAGAATVVPEWAPVAARIRDEATDNWDDRVAVERFEGKGGRFVRGDGRFVAPKTVAVGDRVIEASRGVVIATGTAPAVPPVAGLGDVEFWTNREAVATKELPESLVVLGAGAVGMELAQVFARFGVSVTVLEALDRLLPLEEPEAGALLAEVFEREGIEVRPATTVREVHRAGDQTAVVTSGGDEVVAARLLVATGRRADVAGIGVGNAGLDESARWITVDERLRAGDGLWAVGDVTGVGPFTHVGVYQARIAVADILGRDVPPADYRALPRVTFTDPEVGSVGMSEAAAAAVGHRVRIGVAQVPSSARGWLHKVGNEGFIKLVADADRGVLLGATSVGPTGGEVLAMLTLAVHVPVPLSELRTMMYAYPTFHRGVEDALARLAP